MPETLKILHVIFSVNYMFNGDFKTEWAVFSPNSNAVAIPNDTKAMNVSF